MWKISFGMNLALNQHISPFCFLENNSEMNANEFEGDSI